MRVYFCAYARKSRGGEGRKGKEGRPVDRYFPARRLREARGNGRATDDSLFSVSVFPGGGVPVAAGGAPARPWANVGRPVGNLWQPTTED